MTTTLLITPDRGSIHRPGDYQGAFRPEAENFKLVNGGVVCRIDQSQAADARFRQLLAFIGLHQPQTLAYFGHGLPRALPSAGVTLQNLPQLAAALALASTAPRVVLYACLAAEDLTSGAAGLPGGDGGLADRLRDLCVDKGATGVQVDAHGSSSQLKGRIHDLGGHTTQNPYVRRFTGPQAAIGGQWLVDDKDPLWRAWVRSLRTPFRFQFPYRSISDIHLHLQQQGDLR